MSAMPEVTPMTMIKVPKSDILKSIVPGHVWRIRNFKFNPCAFVVESDRLKDRLIDEDVQQESLNKWLANPAEPVIYGVSGNPDDAQAKLFAAYLASVHLQQLGVAAHVEWVTLYGGFEQPRIMTSHTKPTLIIVSNLTVDSTQFRIEKARDLLESFSDVPRIVVTCGIDPISFFATRLHMPLHRLAYLLDNQVRTKISVI